MEVAELLTPLFPLAQVSLLRERSQWILWPSSSGVGDFRRPRDFEMGSGSSRISILAAQGASEAAFAGASFAHVFVALVRPGHWALVQAAGKRGCAGVVCFLPCQSMRAVGAFSDNWRPRETEFSWPQFVFIKNKPFGRVMPSHVFVLVFIRC